MKSSNFTTRAHDANLRGLREKKPKKQTNWDRIVYLVFLVILALIILYFLTTRFLIVTGHGYLVSGNMAIRAPEDIEIVDICVWTGERVYRGEPLFLYKLLFDEDSEIDTESMLKVELPLKNDLVEFKNEAYVIQKKIAALRDKLAFYQNRAEGVEKEVKLNVSTNNQLFEARRDIKDIKTKIANLRAELYTIHIAIDEQEEKIQIKQEQEQALLSAHKLTQTFTALSSGKVKEISVVENELVFRTEPVMEIDFDNTRIFLRAVFDRDDATHLMPGSILNIEFDNGVESKGKVSDIYAAPVGNLPYLATLNNEERRRKIVIELIPINEKEGKQWKSLGKMSADIYTPIF